MALIRETVYRGAPIPDTELCVMGRSDGGYYLGYSDEDGLPYSRETNYMSKREAEWLLMALNGSGTADAKRKLRLRHFR